MTACANMQTTVNNQNYQLSIQSVNYKSLRINLHCNASNETEIEIKKIISDKLQRGNIDLKITCENNQNENHDFCTWIKQCKKESLPIPTWSDFYIKQKNTTTSTIAVSDIQKDILPKMSKLINEYLKHAEHEGKSLIHFLNTYHKNLNKNLVKINKLLPDIQKTKISQLKKRINTYCNELGEEQKSDLLKETAICLEKLDVQEEADRLHTHLDYFKKLINTEWRGAKVCDFLCQEINREINTMTTKSQSSDISILCVSMKSDLEKIREQIQNLA